MAVILRMAGVAVIASALGLLLKKDNPVFSYFLGIAALCLILSLASQEIRGVVDAAWKLMEQCRLRVDELSAVLKAVGIALLTGISVGLCEEAGFKAAGAVLEFCGAAAILYSAMPLISRMIEKIGALL